MAKRARRLSPRVAIASSVAVIGFSAICASVMIDMPRRKSWRARCWKTSRPASCRHWAQHQALRPVAARGRQQYGDAGDQERQGNPPPDLFDCRDRQHFGAIRYSIPAVDDRPPRSTRGRKPQRRGIFSIHRAIRTRAVHRRPMLHRGAYAIVLSRRVAAEDGAFSASSRARSSSAIFTSCLTV